jgi:flagellar M-ring protein FliF
LDSARGDLITVENLAFDRPDEPDAAPVSVIDRARKGISDFSSLVRYAMLLVLFVLAYLLMIRPMQKRVLTSAAEAPERALMTVPALSLPVPAAPDEVVRTLHLKEQVVEQVKAEPASSARVVQAWLRGETE